MPRKYSEKTVREEFIDFLEKGFNPETLYREDCFNRKGYTFEGKPYTEIYSELLLNYDIISRLNCIQMVRREQSYKPDTHSTPTINDNTNQTEKTIAKQLLNKHFEEFGLVIGYEVPLQDKSGDVGGDIDLFSYNNETNRAFILELKESKSPETLLRCMLEAYTYSKRVDQSKLLQDYGLPSDCTITPAPLVFKMSQAGKEYSELTSRPHLKTLMEALDIQTFTLREEDIPSL